MASLDQMLTALLQSTFLSIASAATGKLLQDKALGSMPTPDADKMAREFSIGDQPLYFFDTLPRLVFESAIIAALSFPWHIWLEKLLPAYPRDLVTSQRGSSDINEKDRPRQAKTGQAPNTAFSWRNTFAKWLIDVFVGGLWRSWAQKAIFMLLGGESPRLVQSDANYFVQLATGDITPLATLIALIVAPAQKRIVFLAGFNFVWDALSWLTVIVLLPLTFTAHRVE